VNSNDREGVPFNGCLPLRFILYPLPLSFRDLPQLFHSRHKIFDGCTGRRELRIDGDLRRAEFARFREVFADLLEIPVNSVRCFSIGVL
jgi:hypothetical protein